MSDPRTTHEVAGDGATGDGEDVTRGAAHGSDHDAPYVGDRPDPDHPLDHGDDETVTTVTSERGTGARRAAHGVVALVREVVIVVVLALVLSFVVKTFLLQAFFIPSGSMEDTLVKGDRVVVSKLTPGPIDLKRGDVVVFADPGDWLDPVPPVQRTPFGKATHEALTFVGLLPDDAENHLIKRVIGLPGDHVVCCDDDGRLTVNGQPVDEPYLKPGVSPSDIDFDVTVPEGKLWVMGDNRSNSADSRFHPKDGDAAAGAVPEDLVVGRAVALVWPLDRITLLTNPSQTFARVPAPDRSDPP